MKLVMLVGPPGSGKTTWCKNHPHINRVSQDDQNKKGHMDLFNDCLINGHDIIVDRMNFDKKQRERYLKPAKEAGYETEIIVLHVPRQTCYERIMARKDHPTINGLHTFENVTTEVTALKIKQANSALDTFFTKYERVEDSEADKVTRLGWVDYSDCEGSAIWCDIDNTLSDASHREHFVTNGNKNWKAFFDTMGMDELNYDIANILETYSLRDYKIVICSGRPDSHKNITESWLLNKAISYDHLFMRNRSDYRRDDVVKEIFLEFEVKTRYLLLFALDDRDQVVKILRKHGVRTLQVAYGDF